MFLQPQMRCVFVCVGYFPQHNTSVKCLDFSRIFRFAAFPVVPLVCRAEPLDHLEEFSIGYADNIPRGTWSNIAPYLQELQSACYFPRVSISVVGHGKHGKSTFIANVICRDQRQPHLPVGTHHACVCVCE